MKPFTVVLMRPDYMTEEFGTDCYIAWVKAKDRRAAVPVGQKEVFKADKKDGNEPNAKEDYAVLFVMEGHQKPVLWGFEL